MKLSEMVVGKWYKVGQLKGAVKFDRLAIERQALDRNLSEKRLEEITAELSAVFLGKGRFYRPLTNA